MCLKKELHKLIQTDENVFDFLLESTLDGLWYWDLESPENAWMNAKFWTVLGYDSGEIQQNNSVWQDIINEDDLKLAIARFTKHYKNSNHPYDQLVRYTHKNGSTVWMRCRGMAIRNKEGKAIRMLGLLQEVSDITRSKQELEKIKIKAEANEEKLKRIFLAAPTGIGVLENQTIVEVNPKICEMIGYSSEELLGQSLKILYPTQKDYEFVINQKNDQIAKYGKGTVETRWKLKDGKVLDVFMSFTPVDIDDLSKGIIFSVFDISDRLKVKQELIVAKERAEESEDRFNLAMNASTDGLFDWNLKTNEIYYSPSWGKMLGYEEQELPNDFSLWQNKIDQADLKKFWCHWKKVITKQIDRFQMEYKMKHKYGHWVYILSRAEVFFNEEGNAVRFIGTHTDITDRKLAREALKKSEMRFKEILKNIKTVAVQGYTMNGQVTYWNKASSDFYGYTEEEAKDKNLLELIIPSELKDDVRNEMSQMAKTEIAIPSSELTLRRKDGSPITVYSSHSFVKVPGKQPEFFCVDIDLSERKQAEDKLNYVSEMQTLILRMATEFINMPKELVNKSLNKYLKELGEFVQADKVYLFEYDWIKNVCNNTFEWCRENVKSEIDNLQNVPMQVIDYWVEAHREGKEITIRDVMCLPPSDGVRQIFEPQGVKSVLAIPMMDHNHCVGFIGFGSVKCTHAYSEEEKTLLKIFSGMLVNVSKRIQIEDRLVQAKEKAEESDRLKSAFLANVSHEIRTPMNGILGFTDLLLEPDFSSEEKEEFIKTVQKSGQRMLNTVSNILEVSKIEAEVISIKKEIIDLSYSFEELIRFFKPEVEKKGLKLIVDKPFPFTEMTINTDQIKFESILTNLIKNAIKYTESGEINIGCNIKNAVVEFYVKDTGIGIPNDRIEAIFNRFEQADNSDTRPFEGSGLGLAIVKSYVEMLGGDIYVESVEGKGSVFYFTLPI